MRRPPFFGPLLFALTACGAAQASKQEAVVAIDENYAPYAYVEQGELKGVYVDLLAAVSATMPHYSIRLLPLPWRRALAEAEHGQVAGVVPPYRRPELRPWMAYSEPLMEEANVLLCTTPVAKAHEHARFPSDFAGTTFANSSGFLNAGAEFFAMVDAGRIRLVEVAGVKQSLQMLSMERVDCMVNTQLVVNDAMSKSTIDASKFTNVGLIRGELAYLGYSATARPGPDQQAFIHEFNAAVAQLRAQGRIPPLNRAP